MASLGWSGADHLRGSQWNHQLHLWKAHHSVYGPKLCAAYFICCLARPIHTNIKATWVLLLCESQIIKALVLPYLLRAHLRGCQTWLFYCPSFIAPPISLITSWYHSHLTDNAFGNDLLFFSRQCHSWIFCFIHMFRALFASWVFWIWIDRLNEMMISVWIVNSACVWGLGLTTNDSNPPPPPPPSKGSLFQTISVNSLFAAFLHSSAHPSCKGYLWAVLHSDEIVADRFMRAFRFLFHPQFRDLLMG